MQFNVIVIISKRQRHEHNPWLKKKKKSLYNCKIILEFINKIANYKPYKSWDIKTIICAYKYMLLWIKIYMNQNPKEPSLALSHHRTENIKALFFFYWQKISLYLKLQLVLYKFINYMHKSTIRKLTQYFQVLNRNT